MQTATFDRKATGFIYVDGVEVASTRRCVHCGKIFMMVRGSGTARGFCRGCMGLTCGDKACDECLAFEKRLDLYEKGQLLDL